MKIKKRRDACLDDSAMTSLQKQKTGLDKIFGTLIENSFDIIMIADTQGTIRYANPTLTKLLGYLPAELIGEKFLNFIVGTDASAAVKNFLERITPSSESPPDIVKMELMLAHKNGSTHNFECNFKKFDMPDNIGIVINARDVSEQKKSEELLLRRSEILEMVARDEPLEVVFRNLILMLESQFNGVYGSIFIMEENEQYMRFGIAPSLPDLGDYLNSIKGQYGGNTLCNWQQITAHDNVIVTDIRQEALWYHYPKFARQYALSTCWSVPVISPQNRLLGVLTLYSREARAPNSIELRLTDIAKLIAHCAIENRHSADTLNRLAHHDTLTGLPNRILLKDRLQQAIIHARRIKGKVATLLIDLDHFKHINDSLGHQVGDHLLQAVARVFQQWLRKEDSLVRLGGDEFVLVLPAPVDSRSAAMVAQKILDTLHLPINVDGHMLHISCSIGISLYPEDGDDTDALMRTADTAMYHAKEKGRSKYQFFTAELNAAAQYRHAIVHQLGQALTQDEFSLAYQCQVNIQSGKIFALEALIRWQQPEYGSISPADFIPIAEDCGLILKIGEWALRQACFQLRAWRDAGYSDLGISVNLSVRQILQPDLVGIVARILRETGLPAQALDLEITESMLMESFEENLVTLEELSNMGVQLSIDDFGTGYSSLSYLRKFPLHSLKIDQSFVRGIGRDTGDMAIINAIIAMAHSLHLNVIAEGVETIEQASFLKLHGCLSAQGYYYSKPVSAETVSRLLCQQFDSAPHYY